MFIWRLALAFGVQGKSAMRLSTLGAAATLLVTVAVWPIGQVCSQTTQGSLGRIPLVSVVGAPAGTEALAVQWVQVTVPDGGGILMAVARPTGAGPFPTVLLLHGSHGFAQ